MKLLLTMLAMALTLSSCQGQEKKEKKAAAVKKTEGREKAFEVSKTDAQWRAELTPMQYDVLRNKATERPGTGQYDKFFEDGVYVCAACGNPLFKSNTKFDAHCGWPSFDAAIKGSVIYKDDYTLGVQRTEVECARCGGHLGHVFDDGPANTTGQRYCTNSVSIKFIPAKK